MRLIFIMIMSSILWMLPIVLSAQKLPGVKNAFFSEILQEHRGFQVLVPKEYQVGSDEKFRVIYVLDGTTMGLIQQSYEFLRKEEFIPPMIIVGVFNVVRNRDFLPTNNPEARGSGKANNFLNFFKRELIPFIDKEYSTSGENILYGHSFGGVFAMYALLTEPKLFDAYLAIDPSFWWDDEYMLQLTKDKLPKLSSKLKGARKKLFIAGREGKAFHSMGIEGMQKTLKEIKIPSELDWQNVNYLDESHNSVRYKSIYDGLKFIFEGYKYDIYLEPDNSPFKLEDAWPASEELPQNLKPGGLSFKYYEGNWSKVPQMDNLKPQLVGNTASNFSLNTLPSPINFACTFEGYLLIEKTGNYVFGLSSDDGSKLFIANRLVIDQDGSHRASDFLSQSVPLKKGYYPIRLEYFQKFENRVLNLVYLPPGKKYALFIPAKLQFYNDVK